MVRVLMSFQVVYFLAFGIVGGAAVSTVIDHRVMLAQRAAMVEIVLSLPPSALTEMRL